MSGGQQSPQASLERRRVDLVEIDVRDLAAGVHAGVGASRARQPGHLVEAQDHGERRLHLALDRPQAGLGGPAPKVGPVVGEVESQPHATTLSVPRLR